ncbi:glutamate-cysteine ligase family protein [Streptomyces sp. ISL-22]|uniref:glutamate-cysteine ligase family protein n=1 Tax=Streptomyces sp. ISL-22 TaxID=2819180 RepID=UPI0027E2963E|nr:glutamate-cysteine ligase family protein [Streptomyces sp. ISL-22]
MQRQAPQLVADIHVHVAVPSRQAGVQVLNRLRVWLPTLTAIAANSRLCDGQDTGFASWRTIVFDTGPSAASRRASPTRRTTTCGYSRCCPPA